MRIILQDRPWVVHVTFVHMINIINFQFHHYHLLMVFQWSVSYRKSPQVSRTLLGVLADLNNAEIWMISFFPLISSFIIIIDKSSHVSRTLLNILADFCYTAVCIISIFSLIFNFFSLSSKPLGSVPSAPPTTGITVTFLFLNFYWYFSPREIFTQVLIYGFSLTSEW